ncbi:MAG: hypothetical protein H6585_10005 [Flavobacteriales bacterium]|nr:hypothetical protein [Flavobacteriales bacterium]
MKTYRHQRFLQENNIDISTLPEMLQKRINIFGVLLKKLDETVEEDKEELLNKLETLDLEIEEDLEDYFDGKLENNEEDYTEEDKAILKAQEEAEQKKKEEEEKAAKQPSDEELLENLLKSGIQLISSAELKQKGFKGKLENRQLRVGNYQLCMGIYDLKYRISKVG